jgi:hypothetical protein
MALDARLVAAVLEGIEGTLEEVIDRVEISELRASLDVLQSRVTALRVSIDLVNAIPMMICFPILDTPKTSKSFLRQILAARA